MTETSEPKTKTFKFHLGTGWGRTCQVKNLPELPGVYSILNREDGECLYVGQAKNIKTRCSSHPVWRSARKKFHNPGIVYRTIECELSVLKKELLYAECLMIGLLRPEWNAVVPARSSNDIIDIQGETVENVLPKGFRNGKFEKVRTNLNHGDNPEVFKSLSVRKSILLALDLNRAEYPKGLTAKEIKLIINRPNSDNGVNVFLRRLVDRHIIFKHNYSKDKRYKTYALPEGWLKD